MRFILPLLALGAAACGGGDDKVAANEAMPSLTTMTEQPGDWSALAGMVGRRPAESGLVDNNSPISVDLNARLGRDAAAFRNAMMPAGPLERQGDLMVARAPDAWLVIQPDEHAFRAALRKGSGWQEWQTPGASVPAI